MANWSADRLGSPYTFFGGVFLVVVWAATGPIYHFSDSWQLVMNTVTNVLTFIMVFLIQNTQNRDTKAMQLKLDELLRAMGEARNQLVALEDAPDEVISSLKQEMQQIKEDAATDADPSVNGASPAENNTEGSPLSIR
jgi:low affinity Fe/Cu permease